MVWTLLEVESESDLIDDDADSVIDVGIELNDRRLGLDDRDFSDEYVVDNDVNETEFRLYLNDLSLLPFLLDSLDLGSSFPRDFPTAATGSGSSVDKYLNNLPNELTIDLEDEVFELSILTNRSSFTSSLPISRVSSLSLVGPIGNEEHEYIASSNTSYECVLRSSLDLMGVAGM